MSSMSFWTDKPADASAARAAETVDSIFHVRCRGLPADHADELRGALCEALPWLAAEAGAAMIPVLGAASGNGWRRPEGEDSFIHLSRRAFFSLRLPASRVADAKRLEGMELSVCGERLRVTNNKLRPLLAHSTLLARCVVAPEAAPELVPELGDESAFLGAVVEHLRAMDIRVGKIMSGQCTRTRIASQRVPVCGVMVAELSPTESLRLQTSGMGDRMTWGCGVFLPHKGIASVGSERETYAAR